MLFSDDERAMEKKSNSAPTKKMNEAFNPAKLAHYVIELIFFMHDRLNFYPYYGKDCKYVVSPQVVVNTISNLERRSKTFFKW